jgi:hypothetical protein
MKYISNNEADGVLERLLRAEIGRATRTGAPCAQFDPDFSTAYIERNLTLGEVARYEVHLAACPKCRIQVAALARMGYQAAVAETAPPIVPSAEAFRTPRSIQGIIPRLFGYLVQPQWIAIGTAALVLLLAVPVFIILKSSKLSPQGDLMSARSPEPAPPAAGKEASADVNQQGDSVHALQSYRESASNGEPLKDREAPTTESPSPAATPLATRATGVIAGAPATTAPAGPSDAVSEKTAADERSREAANAPALRQVTESNPQPNRQQDNEQQYNQANSKPAVLAATGQVQEKQQSPAPPSQVPAGQQYDAVAKKVEQPANSEQISPKEAQTIPEDDKRTGVRVVRPGEVGADRAKAKEGGAAIRPKDSEPPRPESNRDESERRIAKRPATESAPGAGGRSDVDSVHKSTTPLLARSQKLERRVDTKRFRMQAGFWTDRDFKPAKEIPAVTLIRDSEVYKSALEKQPGLKVFLAAFGSEERVIVVYKGIVYKITPSKD